MAQLHFTLDSDFFVGLFSETKDEAFGKLMEALLNQVLQAESTEQLGASNYERSQERSDYRNGVRTRTLTTRIERLNYRFQDIVMFHLKLPCSKIISVMNRL